MHPWWDNSTEISVDNQSHPICICYVPATTSGGQGQSEDRKHVNQSRTSCFVPLEPIPQEQRRRVPWVEWKLSLWPLTHSVLKHPSLINKSCSHLCPLKGPWMTSWTYPKPWHTQSVTPVLRRLSLPGLSSGALCSILVLLNTVYCSHRALLKSLTFWASVSSSTRWSYY